MLSWIIQITIISIILIFLVHHLINFFKSTLTVPKIKDLVNKPIQKYEDIYNIINNNNKNNNNDYNKNISNTKNDDYTLIDLLPKNDDLNIKNEVNMKNELKKFLKSQLNDANNNTNVNNYEFSSIDTNSYSNY